MAGIKSFLERRGKRFWWTVRFVLVALIALAIFVLGWKGGVDYVTNIYTELIGVVLSTVVTVVIVDQYYERRDRELRTEHQRRDTERRTQALKERLVGEVDSEINHIGLRAIEQLREAGWSTGKDSLLKNAHLERANLENANLQDANLQGAKLTNVNLRGAQLLNANLEQAILFIGDFQEAKLAKTNMQRATLIATDLRRASLWGTKLQGAKLWATRLQEADLFGTRLQGAELNGTNLQSANLRGSNLRDASLENVDLKGATLPDGTRSWSNADMRKFTDPTDSMYAETFEKIKVLQNMKWGFDLSSVLEDDDAL